MTVTGHSLIVYVLVASIHRCPLKACISFELSSCVCRLVRLVSMTQITYRRNVLYLRIFYFNMIIE